MSLAETIVHPHVIEHTHNGIYWVKDSQGYIFASAHSLEAAREIACLPILLAEARKIIRKVETGQMRSVRTYGAMKRVIEIVEGKQ